MKSSFALTSFIVCFITSVNADVKVSFYGGISSFKHDVSKIRDPHSKLSDIDYQKLLKALIEFQSFIDRPWGNPLVKDIDFVDASDARNIGFGTAAGDYTSAQGKIREQMLVWLNKAKELFEPLGFEVRGSRPAKIKDKSTLEMPVIYLVRSDMPDFCSYILRNKFRRELEFGQYSFASNLQIMYSINQRAKPDLKKTLAEIDEFLPASLVPSSTKKNGLTLGVSCSYNKSIFPKVSSKYGVYLGIEGFAEINPNEAKAGGYSVKEKSFGIRPFVGLVSNDKWAIYGILGVKCAKRSIKSNEINIAKGKMAYEIGVGSDYILSDRFSISAKFIKTLKTTVRVQNSRLSSTSTKFLLSLNYHIN